MKKDDMQQQLVELGNGAHALATQMLGNADDAADVVHDAFARALSSPAAYDSGKGSLKPWFLRIVRNRCLDLLRRRRPTDSKIDLLAEEGAGPQTLAERAERDQALQTALSRLNKGQREIIVLRDYMDLSYVEIAGTLDIAPGTVMSRLHRARLALKEELSSHG